jgi:hypothetical protein
LESRRYYELFEKDIIRFENSRCTVILAHEFAISYVKSLQWKTREMLLCSEFLWHIITRAEKIFQSYPLVHWKDIFVSFFSFSVKYYILCWRVGAAKATKSYFIEHVLGIYQYTLIRTQRKPEKL